MLEDLRTALKEAEHAKWLVRVWRSFEPGSFDGYVRGVGPIFFLLAALSDEIHTDGFAALRLEDVSDLEAPHEFSRFHEDAIRLRGESWPESGGISLVSVPQLLKTAAESFPLVTIHTEAVDPEVCYIGRIHELNGDSVTLKEIDLDAEWRDVLRKYRYDDITRVDFGGGYEEALWLVSESRRPA